MGAAIDGETDTTAPTPSAGFGVQISGLASRVSGLVFQIENFACRPARKESKRERKEGAAFPFSDTFFFSLTLSLTAEARLLRIVTTSFCECLVRLRLRVVSGRVGAARCIDGETDPTAPSPPAGFGVSGLG